MRPKKLTYAMFLIGLLALLFPVFTLANAAPETPPDGRDINPGEDTTMVQMVKEEVLIDVGMTREVFIFFDDGDVWEGYIVAYNCTYWLVNQGTETENLGVRFPLNTYYEIGKIDIHSIKVDDQPVSWAEDEIDNDDFYDWAHFDVVFPPGEEVEIKVTYTTLACIYSPCGVSYILETGAGWYGPIEQGRIILRLPYQATAKNVFVDGYDPAEYSFSDYDVYWDFTNLEPTEEDNWGVGIVSPDLWLDMLTEWNRLEESPNNTSALYRLAEYISTATIWQWGDDFGIASTSLYEEGLEAIKRAVGLNPGDVKSHELYLVYLRADDSMESYLLILEEVDIILELDPENDIAETYREYALRKLERFQTATAKTIATITPTSTPTPTATLIPSATPTQNTPTPTPEPVEESTPTITPTQLETPEEMEETPANSTGISFGLIFISIGIVLLFGGMAVIRTSKRKKK
jgi:hypothetical protein